uniref:Scavenger receptor class F member 1 n=1 Tax=Leptobrachium leishanense TaxID=445787 RepID=A0A8C5MCB7_9ANUR
MPSIMWRLQLAVMFWSWLQGMCSPDLDPAGENVCKSESATKGLVCCQGWKQEGRACTRAICGNNVCKAYEVCVEPKICMCKPGFFGADCISRCPGQYWGPDCKQTCACFPNGRCDPVTGQCTCNTNRWGPNCENICACVHGICNQTNGVCECEPGWWATQCNKQCQCNLQNSRCNHTNGMCLCNNGYYGQRCAVKCNCNKSPCFQITGRCKCQEGWWGVSCEHQCNCLYGKCNPVTGDCECQAGYQGKRCADPCPPGHYGPKCKKMCERCKEKEACSHVDGSCLSCKPGWNGSFCDQPCLSGYYGENCMQKCPKCRGEEDCVTETGVCLYCDVGQTGLGCNETCPYGSFGFNCSDVCNCNGNPCCPIDGTCRWTSSQKGAMIAGVLIPLSLLFILCCCCCCANNESSQKDRMNNGEGGSLSRMKHNFQGALANIYSVLPCCSVGNAKLSWVTVSHHDPEHPFNHSFIESPSTGWLSDNSFSSFESDDGGPVYCVPPREGMSVADIDGCQEMSSKCNVFPEGLAFSSEDSCQPFSIPRTSSIAKSKRPSVSFAEGTKFESRRSSTTDTPNLTRKPRLALSLPKLPSIQSNTLNGEGSQQPEKTNDNMSQDLEEHPRLQRSMPVGRRRTLSNAQKAALKIDMAESSIGENIYEIKRKNPVISTVYVSVGPPKKPYKPRRKSESNVDGAVQAMLKRLGSLQKGVPKPVRKSLLQPPNFRASQSKISYEEEGKTTNQTADSSSGNSNARLQDNTVKKAVIPTSSILKRVLNKVEGDTECGGSTGDLENVYSSVTDSVVIEQNANEDEHIYQSPEGTAKVEPMYENISIPNTYEQYEQEACPVYEDAEMNRESA